MFDTIKAYCDEILKLVPELKIKPEQLTIQPGEHPYEDFDEAHDWIYSIYLQEYTAVMEVKRLLPDEIWERYRKWGDYESHREMQLLSEALERLRKRLIEKNRPKLFKRKKKDAKTGDKTKGS